MRPWVKLLCTPLHNFWLKTALIHWSFFVCRVTAVTCVQHWKCVLIFIILRCGVVRRHLRHPSCATQKVMLHRPGLTVNSVSQHRRHSRIHWLGFFTLLCPGIQIQILCGLETNGCVAGWEQEREWKNSAITDLTIRIFDSFTKYKKPELPARVREHSCRSQCPSKRQQHATIEDFSLELSDIISIRGSCAQIITWSQLHEIKHIPLFQMEIHWHDKSEFRKKEGSDQCRGCVGKPTQSFFGFFGKKKLWVWPSTNVFTVSWDDEQNKNLCCSLFHCLISSIPQKSEEQLFPSNFSNPWKNHDSIQLQASLACYSVLLGSVRHLGMHNFSPHFKGWFWPKWCATIISVALRKFAHLKNTWNASLDHREKKRKPAWALAEKQMDERSTGVFQPTMKTTVRRTPWCGKAS